MSWSYISWSNNNTKLRQRLSVRQSKLFIAFTYNVTMLSSQSIIISSEMFYYKNQCWTLDYRIMCELKMILLDKNNYYAMTWHSHPPLSYLYYLKALQCCGPSQSNQNLDIDHGQGWRGLFIFIFHRNIFIKNISPGWIEMQKIYKFRT